MIVRGRKLSHYSIDPAMLFKAFAVLILVALCGLAIATLAVSRDVLPHEVSGSPTPHEHQPRTIEKVLSDGDYVTRAPDGEAHVVARFDRPEAFRLLTQSYVGETWPQYRVNVLALYTSDDGNNWTEFAETSEKQGRFVFDLREAGAHKFWKVVVVKSGEAPEIVFGRLSFVKSGNLVGLMHIDVAWLSLVPALFLLLYAFRVPLTRELVFIATCIPVTLFVLLFSFGYADFHTFISSDSLGYLQPILHESYSPFRNAGYPSILLGIHKTVGLDQLGWIQGGIAIACYMAGAWLLATRLKTRWAALAFALSGLFQGVIMEHAPYVMTESLFMAALVLFAASLGALARRPDKAGVIAASLGLVLAIVMKTIGVVLILPALMLIRFLPKGKRLPVSGTIVVSGLAAFMLLGISSFTRTGTLTESYSGFSLIGHVAWMLNDEAMPPSDLTRSMISAVKPVIDQRPPDLHNVKSIAALDRYVNVTVWDYNTLLWQKLVPVAQPFHNGVELNAFFLRFALSSIRHNPTLYFGHVVAHFYGMWKHLRIGNSVHDAALLIRKNSPMLDALRTLVPTSVVADPGEKAITLRAAAQARLPLQIVEWTNSQVPSGWMIAIGILALSLCFLFFIPCRLANTYRAEIMMALSVNAYFGSHVLLQVTLTRYSDAAALAVFLFLLSFTFTTLCALGSGFRLSFLKRSRASVVR